jgi:predicted lipid-binding transport protein (Tim44 family)
MMNPKRKMILMALGLFATIGLSQVVLEAVAEARAGGGRSGGFRGSRSGQEPSQFGQSAQPRRDALPPSQSANPLGGLQSGGFMRGLGTAILGGFLGSMLFSGLANAGGVGGLGSSGFGLFEILLLAGLGYFLYRKFIAPSSALATGSGSMPYRGAQYQAPTPPSYSNNPSLQEPVPLSGVDYRSLTAMDPSFDPNMFLKTAQDIFFKVQGAWNKQDTVGLRSLCGDHLMRTWEEELAQLKSRGQRNRMDNIALRESEISEAWTENGEDYITVRFHANLLDYTVDEKSGAVVNGSDSETVRFEEYWTFIRPVGPNPWKLTAVQQA